MPELTPRRARGILATYGQGPSRTSDPEELERFVADAAALGLTEEGFDWMHWEPYESGQAEDPAFIGAADVTTLRRIATTHARLERFVDGHLWRMQETGVLPAIMARLAELAENDEL